MMMAVMKKIIMMMMQTATANSPMISNGKSETVRSQIFSMLGKIRKHMRKKMFGFILTIK